jgi:hypothetical protein
MKTFLVVATDSSVLLRNDSQEPERIGIMALKALVNVENDCLGLNQNLGKERRLVLRKDGNNGCIQCGNERREGVVKVSYMRR